MPAIPRHALFLALALGAASPFPIVNAAPLPAPAKVDPVEKAWRDATLYLFQESYLGFPKTEAPEARLGRAALLLLQQPKTDANLDAAVAELEALAGDPAPAAAETAATARYLLGRVAHLHRAPADPAAAAAHYRRLIAEHPAHLLADQALVKLALIELHDPALAAEERVARLDAYSVRGDALARVSSRRDLHLTLAGIAWQYRLGDERMLRHYLAADAAGVVSPTQRANVVVSIGELASRVGRTDLARAAFERYLAEFSRDYRRALVRDKLAALPAAVATNSSASSLPPPSAEPTR